MYNTLYISTTEALREHVELYCVFHLPKRRTVNAVSYRGCVCLQWMFWFCYSNVKKTLASHSDVNVCMLTFNDCSHRKLCKVGWHEHTFFNSNAACAINRVSVCWRASVCGWIDSVFGAAQIWRIKIFIETKLLLVQLLLTSPIVSCWHMECYGLPRNYNFSPF